MAKEEQQNQIHVGADDNASGVAAMLEVAEYLSNLKAKGKTADFKRDVIFAAWSGEELGLHGSKHFVDELIKKPVGENDVATDEADDHDFVIRVVDAGKYELNGDPITVEDLKKNLEVVAKMSSDFPIEVIARGDLKFKDLDTVTRLVFDSGLQKITHRMEDDVQKATEENSEGLKVVAALNMDMVGRLEDKLVLQGIGSSDQWEGIIERKNVVVGLPVTLSQDTDLPTDATSFYQAGIPILSAFTGSHSDYHTPQDTPEKLNYPAAARIAKLMGLIVRELATAETVPKYIRQESRPKQAVRGGVRAYLGTVPSYGEDVVGVKLSGTTKGAPADVAGVKGGDIIVSLAGQNIENIYDYTAAIDGLKIGQETTIAVMRGEERIELAITPESRQ